MKACKCDRCGKFYLPDYQSIFVVDKWNGLNWGHLVDLCYDCQGELEEWLNKKGDTKESNN